MRLNDIAMVMAVIGIVGNLIISIVNTEDILTTKGLCSERRYCDFAVPTELGARLNPILCADFETNEGH